eukprot:1104102-Amorphochlora_amoeboformis.AAC.1
MITRSLDVTTLSLLSLFGTVWSVRVNQNVDRALSRENCPSIMDPCDSSDNCYSFRAVKKLHFISPDNLKGREEFENFPKMR